MMSYIHDEIENEGFTETPLMVWYKQYHKKDISAFCQEENELKILVWYSGRDSSTYIKDEAGLEKPGKSN